MKFDFSQVRNNKYFTTIISIIIGFILIGGLVYIIKWAKNKAKNEPFLIEYNVRMGDPECQTLLPKLKTDLLDILLASCDEKLDTINIKNVKKSVIIQSLVDKLYPKISLKDKIEANYDYLLGMDLYKLTTEEIDELKKKSKIKEVEYNTLLSKSANELWKEDINEFTEVYKKELQVYDKEHLTKKPAVKMKKRRTTKKKILIN